MKTGATLEAEVPVQAKPLDIVRLYAALDDMLPRLVAEMPLQAWYQGKPVPRTPPLAWAQPPDIVLKLHRALGDLLKHTDAMAVLKSWAEEGAPEA